MGKECKSTLLIKKGSKYVEAEWFCSNCNKVVAETAIRNLPTVGITLLGCPFCNCSEYLSMREKKNGQSM